MKIKIGDKIFIKAGKDKGKIGKVIQSFPQEGKLVAEGIHILKKHVRARKQGQKGQIIELPAPFYASKAMFYCSRCEKPVRLGAREEAGKKTRICKKCKEAV